MVSQAVSARSTIACREREKLPHGRDGTPSHKLWRMRDSPLRSPGRAVRAGILLSLLAASLAGCGFGDRAPSRYLVITHSALDRVSFFDLDRRELVGVLPTQKLPHDVLLGADGRTLYVVNTGGQCIGTYDLGAASLWRAARAFMTRDTARASGGRTRARPGRVRDLPPGIERHRLTEPDFPERASAVHARAGATTHQSCTDCHDRSVGGKPFAPVFVDGGRTIRLVHLAACDLTELDATTLAVKRRTPLPVPAGYAPVEAWVRPGTDTAFVTCRDSIGKGLPGLVAIVDLAHGTRVRLLVPGIYPWHLVPSPDGTHLYVNDFQSSRVSVIDVARELVVDSLVAENGPSAILPVDGGRRLLVSCFYTHRVLVLDPASRAVLRRIDVGSNPTTLLPAGDARHVWVLCGGESALEKIDLETGRIVEKHALLFGAYAMMLVPPNAKRS